MSEHPEIEPESVASEPDEVADSELDRLIVEAEVLREENERLRAALAETRRRGFRRTSIGFAVLGIVSLGGAILFPDARVVLLALGGTGVFLGVLTWYITPEQFVATSIAERIFRAFAETLARLQGELGLSDVNVYVPLSDSIEGAPTAVLFIPARTDEYRLPNEAALHGQLIHADPTDSRGIAVRPTGAGLYEEFEQALSEPLATDPSHLVDQLTDGLVEQFELVTQATPQEPITDDEVIIRVAGAEIGRLDDVDHPAVSFLATGLAHGLGSPVEVEAEPFEDDDGGLVICSWA